MTMDGCALPVGWKERLRAMCEANVYILRGGNEELLMEKVDRVIPGQDDMIFLESIFGERKIIKARIKEMELVHHRIILDEIEESSKTREIEIWLEPQTQHGHFHPGEEAKLKLSKGYNMQSLADAPLDAPKVFLARDGKEEEIQFLASSDFSEINLGEVADGLVTVWAYESGACDLYAKVIVEVGHHHHHEIKPVGLPLEIAPVDYSHVHLGDNYRIQVLKGGEPLAGAEVRATYTGSHRREYPFRLKTDEAGKAGVFLTARGNWLFSVKDDHVISTFTLIKSF